MKIISIAEFVERYKDYPLSRFGAVDTAKTEETLKKNRATGEPVLEGCVTSTCRYNPAIGMDYGDVLHTRREKEGKTADFVPYLIDESSGVGTQIVAGPCSNKSYPDIVVGNKRGTFYLQHEARKVSKSEWDAAQPKLVGQ